jgi:hypothetical protein
VPAARRSRSRLASTLGFRVRPPGDPVVGSCELQFAAKERWRCVELSWKKAKGRTKAAPANLTQEQFASVLSTSEDMRQQFQATMLATAFQLDDIIRACARRFTASPHRYRIEGWRGSTLVLKFYGDGVLEGGSRASRDAMRQRGTSHLQKSGCRR